MSDSITCPKCGMTSYNPMDIAQRYCGNCHEFHANMETNSLERELRGFVDHVFQQHCECCERLADELIAADVVKREFGTSPGLHRTMMLHSIHEIMESKSFFLSPANYKYTKKVVMRNLMARKG